MVPCEISNILSTNVFLRLRIIVQTYMTILNIKSRVFLNSSFNLSHLSLYSLFNLQIIYKLSSR